LGIFPLAQIDVRFAATRQASYVNMEFAAKLNPKRVVEKLPPVN
jgi:hypothetical protein